MGCLGSCLETVLMEEDALEEEVDKLKRALKNTLKQEATAQDSCALLSAEIV
jgi:hypothetical protein